MIERAVILSSAFCSAPFKTAARNPTPNWIRAAIKLEKPRACRLIQAARFILSQSESRRFIGPVFLCVPVPVLRK